MSRRRSGTVIRLPSGRWRVGITLPTGKRWWKTLAPGTSEAMARERAAFYAERGVEAFDQGFAEGSASGAAGETLAAYAERWLEERERRGLTTVRDDRGRLTTHVFPTLRDKPVAGIAREDMEDLVEALDAKVRAGELSWKTAWNTWAVLRRLFADACCSKIRALRVCTSSPCDGVAPPDRGVRRSLCYLHPSEFLAFVTSEDVPLPWRRLLAFGVYTYMRTAELQALRWEDVDFEHGNIHVHRATDRAGTGEKSTKTKRPRRLPIEPALLPLLRAMHAEAGGDEQARVTWMPSRRALARGFRHYLRKAGVKRAELFITDATRKNVRFYDATRSTGITWCAVRGDDPLRIKQRAGHERFETTEGYIREAENLADGFGAAFPELPTGLLTPAQPIAPIEGARSDVRSDPQSVPLTADPTPDRCPDQVDRRSDPRSAPRSAARTRRRPAARPRYRSRFRSRTGEVSETMAGWTGLEPRKWHRPFGESGLYPA